MHIVMEFNPKIFRVILLYQERKKKSKNADMVEWYNLSLPRRRRGFDSRYPPRVNEIVLLKKTIPLS